MFSTVNGRYRVTGPIHDVNLEKTLLPVGWATDLPFKGDLICRLIHCLLFFLFDENLLKIDDTSPGDALFEIHFSFPYASPKYPPPQAKAQIDLAGYRSSRKALDVTWICRTWGKSGSWLWETEDKWHNHVGEWHRMITLSTEVSQRNNHIRTSEDRPRRRAIVASSSDRLTSEALH